MKWIALRPASFTSPPSPRPLGALLHGQKCAKSKMSASSSFDANPTQGEVYDFDHREDWRRSVSLGLGNN
jgi:hypothetical protein